ncbi:uncharacterized protein LOC115720025 isoform X2 [Cannabis sativa]|uniref:uncharacterized protein LOC115720025 isoform X2 n=1 Tax=Cannabis sativa TaxID=3483 RepID=UPI0029CAA3AB|nr:uncharacterized protein LOC115720025 isoform X2 [Cannabis sativa]
MVHPNNVMETRIRIVKKKRKSSSSHEKILDVLKELKERNAEIRRDVAEIKNQIVESRKIIDNDMTEIKNDLKHIGQLLQSFFNQASVSKVNTLGEEKNNYVSK